MLVGVLRVNEKHDKEKATYIGWAHDATNLFHRVQIGAETSVHREYLLVDNSGDR